MSVAEAAEMLELSAARVRTMIANKRLPARKIGNSWVISYHSVLALHGLDRPGGQPLLPVNAWNEIVAGRADPFNWSKYVRRGKIIRFFSSWQRWPAMDPGFDVLVSGTDAAVELLEPHTNDPEISLPARGQEQDAYLCEGSEDALAETVVLQEVSSHCGESVVRLVPPDAWEIAKAHAVPSKEHEGVKLAPPLAVALDVVLHASGRSESVAWMLAKCYGVANEVAT